MAIALSAEVLLQKRGLPERPEEFGPALAHVVVAGDGRETLLGQAWIAGANMLVTCGHVVEPYVHKPHELAVVFPGSGKRYEIRGIKLHPRFAHQGDQLINFDAAIIYVDLRYPESSAAPLPIQFDKGLSGQQSLSAVRFPVHLGQLGGNPNPLAQLGRYLGPLRKQDNVHLLHDLALSPGDSGTPIFDGTTVIALHCGDTATLPGLNLPTTAIRLALKVDSLRELGIGETFVPPMPKRYGLRVWALIASFIAGFAIFAICVFLLMPQPTTMSTQQPEMLPIDVTFNEPVNGYKPGEAVTITLAPRSSSYVYLFYADDTEAVQLYPPYGGSAFIQGGQFRTIGTLGSSSLRASQSRSKLFLVSLKTEKSLLSTKDYDEQEPAGKPLKKSPHDLEKLLKDEVAGEPAAIFAKLEGPSAAEETE